MKPIFLFADSQLLFYKDNNKLFLDKVKECFNPEENERGLKAAYIGASNNDDFQYYDIFRMGMEGINVVDCHMIMSNPDEFDNEFLNDADIILLAGGDTIRGLEVIRQNGWNKIILEKYSMGTLLIGISAGAIQLGLFGCGEGFSTESTGFGMLGLVPHIIDVHADDDWVNLENMVVKQDGCFVGYGIPFGAGIIYYPDYTLEAVCSSCTEVIISDDEVIKTLILPMGRQRTEFNKIENVNRRIY